MLQLPHIWCSQSPHFLFLSNFCYYKGIFMKSEIHCIAHDNALQRRVGIVLSVWRWWGYQWSMGVEVATTHSPHQTNESQCSGFSKIIRAFVASSWSFLLHIGHGERWSLIMATQLPTQCNAMNHNICFFPQNHRNHHWCFLKTTAIVLVYYHNYKWHYVALVLNSRP